MKISKDMVTVLNNELKESGAAFRFEFKMENNPKIEVVPVSNIYVDSCIINLTKEYLEILQKFFLERGIELNCNNTGSIFWSKNGFMDN